LRQGGEENAALKRHTNDSEATKKARSNENLELSMLDQYHSITQAAGIVAGTAGSPQERLAKGFKAFRRATILSNDWPVELWEKYDCICNTLLAGGTWQRTIDKMDLKAASECGAQISKAMKDLAVDVELARRHAEVPHVAVRLEPVEES
jgi:hypothetical protein